MKKAFLYGLFLYTVFSWTTSTAEASLQAALAKITSPGDNAVVRGTVPIVGTAVDPAFWKYEIHYAPEPNPSDRWTLIGAIHETQVIDGLLETWNTTAIPDGRYSLRLRVVNRTGNYNEVFVRGILVVNTAPTETPTPAQAPPTATITPEATPTFIIPPSPLAQPTATPTLARPRHSELPEVLDFSFLRQWFCLGAQLTVVILLLLALIFALRRFF